MVKPQVGREDQRSWDIVVRGLLNCSRERKVRCQRSIRYWILRRWPRRMPRIRILLESSKAGQLSPGDPVLFRGYRGSVETSTFDTQKRRNLPAVHQCAERSPVTTNVRFWKDSGSQI